MKRRDFITKTTFSLGAISLTNTSSFFIKEEKKLGIALVGLGNYSTRQLAPALLETKHCRLAGIVTGLKMMKWSLPSTTCCTWYMPAGRTTSPTLTFEENLAIPFLPTDNVSWCCA